MNFVVQVKTRLMLERGTSIKMKILFSNFIKILLSNIIKIMYNFF